MGKPTETQIEISNNLIKAFNPTKWFLQFFLRFPFKIQKAKDDTWAFEFKPKSFPALTFYVSSVISIIFFGLVFVGTIVAYFFEKDKPHDRCGMTWETTMMTRQFTPIMFAITQLAITAVGSLYAIKYSNDFVHLYNFWNKSLMTMNFDPTKGARWLAFRGHIIFLSVMLLSILLYASGKLIALEESSAFIIQSVTIFFYKDLYTYHQPGGTLTVKEFKNLSARCCDCQKCFWGLEKNEKNCTANECWNAINHTNTDYELLKFIGFFFQVYAMMGARCLIIQFEFFCHLLVNCCRVWNSRFTNGLSKNRKVDINKPERRRLSYRCLIVDHATIIQLFEMTEENFNAVLCTYYACLFVNITCQLYYLALINTQSSCAEAVQREVDFVDPDGNRCINLEDMKHYGDEDRVSFEDPCRRLNGDRAQSAEVAFILFIVTLFMFFSSVKEASEAAQEGKLGFIRLRKHGYLSCNSKVERHFIHTLVFSFVGPTPIQISGGGYFVVRPRVVLIVLATCLLYFLIVLGFKPGVIKPIIRCEDGAGKAIMNYPKFIW